MTPYSRRIVVTTFLAFTATGQSTAQPRELKKALSLLESLELHLSGSSSYLSFTTSEATEVTKKGGAAYGAANLVLPLGPLALRGGWGFWAGSLTGTHEDPDSLEVIRETQFIGTASAEIGADLRMHRRVALGFSVQNISSPGASFRYADKSTMRSLYYTGPRLTITLPEAFHWDNYLTDTSIFTEYMRDLNIQNNAISFFTIGASVRVPLPWQREIMVAEAEVVAEPAPRPLPPAIITPNIREDQHFIIAQFDFAKSAINPGAQKIIKRLAVLLLAQQSKWQSLEVWGHADKIGSQQANLRVSTLRAEHVRALLGKHGMAATTIEISGKGSELLRPEFSAKGRMQRRVELLVRGSSGGEAFTRAILAAISQPL